MTRLTNRTKTLKPDHHKGHSAIRTLQQTRYRAEKDCALQMNMRLTINRTPSFALPPGINFTHFLATKHQHDVSSPRRRANLESMSTIGIFLTLIDAESPATFSKLDFRPHIHILMPALALNRTANTISQCKGNYLFNVKSVADVFRAKCLDAFTKTDITLPRGVPSQWNVHCKPVGRGSSTLKYLARYLYRGVISENQILSIDSGQIEYNFLSSSSGQYERRVLPAAQFLWKVLMHVLPLGFQRARCYGFLHHNARVILQRIQLLLHATIEIIEDTSSERRMPCCKQCHARLRLHSIWRPPVNRNTIRRSRASPPVA